MPRKKSEEVVESVAVRNSVTLSKNGVTFELSNPIMISAFKNQGYEVEE